MELLFMLWVWFMLFIGIPFICVVIIIVLMYYMINKTARNNLFMKFKNLTVEKPEHVEYYKRKQAEKESKTNANNISFNTNYDRENKRAFNNNQQDTIKQKPRKKEKVKKVKSRINAETSTVVEDFIENINGKSFGMFEIIDIEKILDNRILVNSKLTSLYDNNKKINKSNKDRYINFLKENDYDSRIKFTFEKDSNVVGQLVDELNREIRKDLTETVEEDGGLIIQQQFAMFLKKYKKKVHVDEISVVIEVKNSEVFTPETFSDLKVMLKE